MKVGRLCISYLKCILDVEILTLMTENLLEVACCGTALCFIQGNYYIPFRTLTNKVLVEVSCNSNYSMHCLMIFLVTVAT